MRSPRPSPLVPQECVATLHLQGGEAELSATKADVVVQGTHWNFIFNSCQCRVSKIVRLKVSLISHYFQSVRCYILFEVRSTVARAGKRRETLKGNKCGRLGFEDTFAWFLSISRSINGPWFRIDDAPAANLVLTVLTQQASESNFTVSLISHRNLSF